MKRIRNYSISGSKYFILGVIFLVTVIITFISMKFEQIMPSATTMADATLPTVAMDTDEAMVFMDNETYDQVEIPMDRLKWERNFIVPNSNVNISSYEGEILGVILPDKATLKVVECEQAVKGDTATSASKNAVLETGLEVKVPLFINQDEMIVVNTNDGKYSGRAK